MGNENFKKKQKKKLSSCHDIQAYVCSSAGVGKKCIDTAFKNRPKAAALQMTGLMHSGVF